VVYAHAVPLDLQDFRPLIAKMRDAGAGAFYFPMLPPPLLSFIWQVRELQVEAHLMTGDAFIQDVVRQGGRASEGIYMTNIHYPDTAQLLVSYQRKFGAEPVDFPVVACGYDGMKRVIEAVKLVQKSMSMQRALADVLGPERTAQRREAIFQVNNGQRILVYAPAQGKN
jgi:ABC-type branched-subunit amino acid transport system substrate-binding protein